MATDALNKTMMLHEEISRKILGCGMTVSNALKPGLSEKAYEKALGIELKKAGLLVDQQQRFDVLYDGIIVDTLIPDLIVDGSVIVDTKVVEDFSPTHIAQMLGYLTITDLRLGLLINFRHADLRWKRVVR